jgi:hypothetical protein
MTAGLNAKRRGGKGPLRAELGGGTVCHCEEPAKRATKQSIRLESRTRLRRARDNKANGITAKNSAECELRDLGDFAVKSGFIRG